MGMPGMNVQSQQSCYDQPCQPQSAQVNMYMGMPGMPGMNMGMNVQSQQSCYDQPCQPQSAQVNMYMGIPGMPGMNMGMNVQQGAFGQNAQMSMGMPGMGMNMQWFYQPTNAQVNMNMGIPGMMQGMNMGMNMWVSQSTNAKGQLTGASMDFMGMKMVVKVDPNTGSMNMNQGFGF